MTAAQIQSVPHHPTPAFASRDLMARLLKGYIRPYWKPLVLSLLFMMVAAAATGALAKLMEPILDKVFVAKDKSSLLNVCAMILSVFAVKGISTYLQETYISFVGQRIIADMQNNLFRHLMKADLKFFHSSSTGMLISRFTNDVTLLRTAVSNVITGVGKDFLTLVVLIGVMFYQDWLLAMLSFLVFPVAIYPIVKTGRKMRKVATNTQMEMGDFTTHLDQTFQEMRNVKAYQLEDRKTREAATLIERLFRLNYRSVRIRAASKPIMETLGGLAIVAVVFYGGWLVIQGERSTGTFFSFITAFLLAYEPVKRLANFNLYLQEGLSAAQRLFAMLDASEEIQDQPNAQPLQITHGQIHFERINFSYTSGEQILSDVTLDVPAGKTVALVGASGAGKSTILNLIPRFFDISHGQITIDGQDIRAVTLESLRKSIALVAQDVGLFDRSVRDNIAFGREDATEAEIIQAARDAAAHDFILDLPNGYDTLVGERGVNLSGGQRQRLAIARALLKNAPILLLDEATSALDTESEKQVQLALKNLMRNRTTLIIAHRLSTILDADTIYVIDDGRVVEHGTHLDLLKNKKTYARLYQLQFAAEAA